MSALHTASPMEQQPQAMGFAPQYGFAPPQPTGYVGAPSASPFWPPQGQTAPPQQGPRVMDEQQYMRQPGVSPKRDPHAQLLAGFPPGSYIVPDGARDCARLWLE